MLHVFIDKILANVTQVSDVAPGPFAFSTRIHVALQCISRIIYSTFPPKYRVTFLF
jgi:hypothetical protein